MSNWEEVIVVIKVSVNKRISYFHMFFLILLVFLFLFVHVCSAQSDVSIGVVRQNIVVPQFELNINSYPEGANIYFDKVNIGKTPFVYVISDNQVHDVRLDLYGYDSWEEEYNPLVDSNAIMASLIKTEDPTPSRNIIGNGRILKVEPHILISHMNLSIDSNPEGADIFIDGDNIGKTPKDDYTIINLKTYKIRLVLDGYDSWDEDYFPDPDSNVIVVTLNKTKEKEPSEHPTEVTEEKTPSTEVTEEKTPSMEVTEGLTPSMEAFHTTLSIDSSPDGSDIYLDGVNIGKTPMNYEVNDPNAHVIRFKLNGYDDWEGKYYPKPDTDTVKVFLNKAKDITPSKEESKETKSPLENEGKIDPDSTIRNDITSSSPVTSNPPEKGPEFLGVPSLIILLCAYLIVRYVK
jgi:PEGA domain